MDYGNLKVPESVTPEVQAILDSYEARNKEIERNHLKNMGRIGLGTAISSIGILPFAITKNPIAASGLGGALYEFGQGLVEGDKTPELLARTGMGATVGAVAGKALPAFAKSKAGQAIGNQASKLYNSFADTKIGQKVTEIAPKVEDLLMTDIKAFNPNKQTVYHGSPYDFAKFSNEAIGTGEGAQAHGYGHYAAKSKDVAEGYRRNLSKKDTPYEEYKTLTQYIDFLNGLKEKAGLSEGLENALQKSKTELSNLMNTYKPEEYLNNVNNGQLYKLSIPKDDVMLREDLPFNKQPKAVQDGLENYFKDLVALNKGGFQAGKTLVTPVSEEQLLRDYIYNNGDVSSLGIYRGLADRKKTFHELHKDPISSNYAQQQITNDLSDYGIKGISYNGGIDGEARVIFNPDDIEIVRKYYNQPELWDKLKGLRPNEGAELAAIENALRNPQFPMNEQDFNAYEDLGLRYYQNIFQPNTIEIPGYGVASFSRKNRGKDDVTNFRMYPDLFELLTGAKPVNRTNYKNELDRQYDYLENPNNKIYQFLMEDIKDKGKRYKMMRNKETGK